MKIVKCENKHFYDADAFGACPHCNKLKAAPHFPPPLSVQARAPSPQPAPKQENIFCAFCGKPLPGQNRFCPFCGKQMPVKGGDQNRANAISQLLSSSPQKPADNFGDTVRIPHISAAGQADSAAETAGRDAPGDAAAPSSAEFSAAELNAAVAAAASHSASEDVRSVAFYDVDGETSAVVGWLVCVKGEYKGRAFELRSGLNNVGRAQNMGVALAREPSVSRNRHAAIIFDPAVQMFHVAQGEGGGLTYLNGALVTGRERLRAYDKIQLGAAGFVFAPLCGERFSWDDYNGNEA